MSGAQPDYRACATEFIHPATVSNLRPARQPLLSATPSGSPSNSIAKPFQVSIAHAFPGTEFFDFVEKNGFITNKKIEDGDGYQMAHIE
jgi:hypothetical protein